MGNSIKMKGFPLMKPFLGTVVFGLLIALLAAPVGALPTDNANIRAVEAQVEKASGRVVQALDDTTERGEVAKQQAEERREVIRVQVEERREEIRQKVEERKVVIQKNVCERRITSLKRTMPRVSQGATSVKESLDTMYERVQGFYESGQLTVANYEELTALIDTEKAEAESAIELVDAAAFVPDCENETVGEQLDSYRLTVQAAKDELKAYRTALVQLINSLQSGVATSQEVEADTEGVSDEQ